MYRASPNSVFSCTITSTVQKENAKQEGHKLKGNELKEEGNVQRWFEPHLRIESVLSSENQKLKNTYPGTGSLTGEVLVNAGVTEECVTTYDSYTFRSRVAL